MSNEKNVHVVPHEGGWATRRPNSGRVSRTFDTQFAVFDLRHDFPNEWYKAMQVPAGATERVIAIDTLLDRLPIFTKNTLPPKFLPKMFTCLRQQHSRQPT